MVTYSEVKLIITKQTSSLQSSVVQGYALSPTLFSFIYKWFERAESGSSLWKWWTLYMVLSWIKELA